MKKRTALKSLFLMERYLKTGTKPEGGPSKKDTTRIISEYNLVKTKGYYYGDREAIFSIFQDKYPEASSRFSSYIDLFFFVRDLTGPDFDTIYGRRRPCCDTGLYVSRWGFFQDDDVDEFMGILADNLNWDFT